MLHFFGMKPDSGCLNVEGRVIEKTDAQLLREAREGSGDSFKELVRRYESRVAATVVGMLGRCPEADDVGQETFIRFYKAMHDFRGDAELGTYLTRIAINLSLNELKRRKRRFQVFPKSTDSVHDMTDDSINPDAGDTKAVINKALQKLEPDFRSVVVLRLIQGYSTKEAAGMLNIPEGTVLSRLSRAQLKLKKILEPLMGEQE